MEDSILKYVNIQNEIKAGMTSNEAAQHAGYADRKGYEALRSRLKKQGLLDSAGDITAEARKLLGVDPAVADDPKARFKDIKQAKAVAIVADSQIHAVDEDYTAPSMEFGSAEIMKRSLAVPATVASKPKSKREYRYQVALSEPVREFLEAECKLDNLEVSKRIGQICADYYRRNAGK